MKKLLLLFTTLLIIGCGEQPKIEKGDLVCECIIDSIQIKQSISTIEPDPMYIVYTNCGTKLQTYRNDIYHIGDTITYLYKKK
jgi:hypothetical protein